MPEPRTIDLPLALMTTALASLGLAAALAGLVWQGAPPPSVDVVSVRGEPVTLFGEGAYRYNPLMLGAGFRAQDVVLLAVLPLAAWSAWTVRPEGRVTLLAALGYLIYVHASLALMAAYDWLLPAYIALFSLGVFSLWRAGHRGLAHVPEPAWPRRGMAVYLALAGGTTFVIWAPPLMAELAAGGVPARLATQTTAVTHVLDLGLIVPLCMVAAVLVWRRRVFGHVIALPLLGCIVGLLPTITLATAFQIAAGVRFSTAEIVGPIVGFLLLGGAGAWFLGLHLRAARQA